MDNIQGSMSHQIKCLDCIEEHYRVVKKLGSGTYGRVMLVQELASGANVALKILPKAKTKEKDFIREYEVTSYLSRHSGVIDLRDSAAHCTPTEWMFTMELAPFGDLYEMISKKLHCRKDGANCGIQEEPAKRVFRQLASAITYMHSLNLVHRDVKPENVVLFDPDCQLVKLMDFGMTKPVGTTVRKVSLGIPYTPPEICERMKGDRYSIETGSDCWSFGVLVFCALTGNFPWQLADRSRDPFYGEFCNWRDSDDTTCQAVQWRHFSTEAMQLFRRLFQMTPSARRDDDLMAAADIESFMREPRAAHANVPGAKPATCTTTASTPATPTASGQLDTSTTSPSILADHNIKNTVSNKWKTKRLTKWLQSL